MRPLLLFLGIFACVKAEQPSDDGGVDSGHAEPEDLKDTGEAPDPLDDIDVDSLPAGPNPCRGPVKGEVEEITDGDTLKVKTGRGVERVRLIGIDAPEVDHSGPDDDCYGEEAKAFLSGMVEGKTVWLTFDVECEDDYDRTLAYVHRGLEDNEFIQRLLLRGGWVSTFAVYPNVGFRSLFELDESEAQGGGLGLWSDCR